MKGLLSLMVLVLSGCGSGTALRASATLPAEALTAPQHYVVVTVRNPVGLPTTHAASTPRGYDNIGPYQAGRLARTAAAALARDYRLQETASWPIALLEVHCLVYKIAAEADAAQLIARLSRDPRVESAQALLGFETAAHTYNDPYAPLQQN